MMGVIRAMVSLLLFRCSEQEIRLRCGCTWLLWLSHSCTLITLRLTSIGRMRPTSARDLLAEQNILIGFLKET